MARSRLRLNSLLGVASLCVLAGCETTSSPPTTSSGGSVAPEPFARVEEAPAPSLAPPPAPPVRPSAGRLWLPDGCTAEQGEDGFSVSCPEGGLEVRWAQGPPPPERLDSWTQERIDSLRSHGVPMVLVGLPQCTVQDEPVDCKRLLGRSAEGVEETMFLAVGPSPDGGAVEVNCYWNKRADENSFQSLCQQVLRRI